MSKGIIIMVFDPLSFLELANNLHVDINYEDEAAYRTSTSRAYYAAYLICRKYLENNEHTFSKSAKAHREVMNEVNKKDPHVRSLLHKLRLNRNAADYDMDTPYGKGFTISSLKLAQKIIDKIDAFT